MDHLAQTNHTVDWEKVMFPVKDHVMNHTWAIHDIKEAISIRKTGANSINRDRGATNF